MTVPTETVTPMKPTKRKIALTIFLATAAVASVGGAFYWHHAAQFEDTDDAFVDGNIIPISPQIGGRIAKVLVQDNQDVKAGDVLAEIDTTDYNNAVGQAQGAYDVARSKVQVAQANLTLLKATTEATLTQAKAGVSEAQAAIANAQAGIQQAQATLKRGEAQVQSAQADVDAAQAEATRRTADAKRYEAIDPRATSQQQRDTARATADSANAQLTAAQKRKLAAEAQLSEDESKLTAAKAILEAAQARKNLAEGALQTAQTAPEQITAAEAQLKSAQAAAEQAKFTLATAQQQLGYTKIHAPISGRVTRKSVQLGQVVEPGRLLMTLVSSTVWVTANFKETQLTHMHAGQTVDLWVDMYPTHVFKGHVDSFQSGSGARFSLMPPENATGNYVKVVQRVPVKIVFDENPGAQLLLGPGMSVTPRVHLYSAEGSPNPIVNAGVK